MKFWGEISVTEASDIVSWFEHPTYQNIISALLEGEQEVIINEVLKYAKLPGEEVRAAVAAGRIEQLAALRSFYESAKGIIETEKKV